VTKIIFPIVFIFSSAIIFPYCIGALERQSSLNIETLHKRIWDVRKAKREEADSVTEQVTLTFAHEAKMLLMPIQKQEQLNAQRKKNKLEAASLWNTALTKELERNRLELIKSNKRLRQLRRELAATKRKKSRFYIDESDEEDASSSGPIVRASRESAHPAAERTETSRELTPQTLKDDEDMHSSSADVLLRKDELTHLVKGKSAPPLSRSFSVDSALHLPGELPFSPVVEDKAFMLPFSVDSAVPLLGEPPFPPVVEDRASAVPLLGKPPFPPVVEDKASALPLPGKPPFPPVVEDKASAVPLPGKPPFPPVVEDKASAVPLLGEPPFPPVVEDRAFIASRVFPTDVYSALKLRSETFPPSETWFCSDLLSLQESIASVIGLDTDNTKTNKILIQVAILSSEVVRDALASLSLSRQIEEAYEKKGRLAQETNRVKTQLNSARIEERRILANICDIQTNGMYGEFTCYTLFT
jgi:hypothetical protein